MRSWDDVGKCAHSRLSTTMFASSADCHRRGSPLFWRVEPKPGKWSVGVKGEDFLVFSANTHYPVPYPEAAIGHTVLCRLATLNLEPSNHLHTVEKRRSAFLVSFFSQEAGI